MSAAVCSLGSLLRRPALCAIVIGASALTGCAAYQHRIIEPAEAAGVVPDAGRAFVMEPLEYEAYEDGGRLALRVYNPDVMPITLLGERSYLVDPQGETRAIGAGTIAPGSHITLFLPPQVDRVRTGPRFGTAAGLLEEVCIAIRGPIRHTRTNRSLSGDGSPASSSFSSPTSAEKNASSTNWRSNANASIEPGEY